MPEAEQADRRMVWKSRCVDGTPCVPVPVVVLDDAENLWGEITVVRPGFPNEMCLHILKEWTHQTFAEAKTAAIQACHEAIEYHNHMLSTLNLAQEPGDA